MNTVLALHLKLNDICILTDDNEKNIQLAINRLTAFLLSPANIFTLFGDYPWT